MLKIVLIGLVLVHAALQIEIVPEFDSHGPKHVESKKYYSKEHKKYKNKESWKDQNEEKGKKRYDDEFEKHADGEKKYKSEKPKKYYKEDKAKYARSITTVESSTPELIQNNQDEIRSLASDTNVNYRGRIEAENPHSEAVATVKKNFYNEIPKIDLSSPPDANNTALMARYIVHKVDWAALSTMTSRFSGKHFPFANLLSMSDGPVDTSSGVPFFYITAKDLSTQDLISDNKASIVMSLAQTDFCRSKKLDPEEPPCARIIISGKIKKIKAGTAEEEFASNALFSRHPAMKDWPKDHEFYLAKMKIGQIIVLDQYGGPKYVDIEQYLHHPQK